MNEFKNCIIGDDVKNRSDEILGKVEIFENNSVVIAELISEIKELKNTLSKSSYITHDELCIITEALKSMDNKKYTKEQIEGLIKKFNS